MMMQLPMGNDAASRGRSLRLAVAADVVAADPVFAESQGMERALYELLDECLADGDDAAVTQAFAHLRERPHAVAALREAVESASTTALLELDDGTKVCRLMAIPLVVAPTSRPAPVRQPAASIAMEAFGRSLQRLPAVAGAEAVALGARLYRPEELQSLEPSAVAALARSLVTPPSEAAVPSCEEPIGATDAGAAADEGAASGGLRFLLAALIEDLATPTRCGTTGLAAMGEQEPRMQAWAARAAEPLATVLGRSSSELTVIGIAPYAQGLRIGATLQRKTRLAGHSLAG